jgi:hypothetical protein
VIDADCTMLCAAVMLSVVVLAALVAAVFWQRKRASAREAALRRKYELEQEAKFVVSMHDNTGGMFPSGRPLGSGWSGLGGGSQQALAPQGPGVPVGLLGRPGDM